MKNSIRNFLHLLWSITTDVPGWPDAPRALRIQRLIRIILPVIATLLIFLWIVAWRNPHTRAERDAHRPAMALEAEVTNLRLAYSDQQTADIAAQTSEASRVLLDKPDELPPLLERLKAAAASFGWEANLIPTAAPTPPPLTEAQHYFLPARGKLVPLASNAEPFSSLLAFLEKLPTADKWIDLIRMNLRADEQGKLTVEIYLRTACRVPHEKTPQ